MMSQSMVHLREALEKMERKHPRKPTSVPPMTFEAVLKRAQDRHRTRPPTWRERLSQWLWQRGWI